MKKLILISAAALMASVMTSCYKHTVCATYTKAIDKVDTEKTNESL